MNGNLTHEKVHLKRETAPFPVDEATISKVMKESGADTLGPEEQSPILHMACHATCDGSPYEPDLQLQKKALAKMQELSPDFAALPLSLGTEQVLFCLGISRAKLNRCVKDGRIRNPTKSCATNLWCKTYIAYLMEHGIA